MVPFKDKLFRMSMGTKLSITFLLVILCVSFPMSYLSSRYSESLLKKQIEESILENVRAEETNIRTALLNRDYWRVYKHAEALSSLKGIKHVAILDENRFVVAHSLPQEYPVGTFYPISVGEQVVYVESFGRRLGYVVFKIDTGFLESSLLPLKFFMVGFTALFSTIGVSLGIYISMRISGRLKRILRMAEDAERGKLYKVSFVEKDELQEFSDHLYDSFESINRLLENARFEGEFFSSLLNALEEMVFVLDREGRILFVNSSVSKYGYGYKDLLGRKLLCLLCDAGLRKEVRRAIREGEALTLEGKFRGKGGQREVLLSLKPKEDFLLASLKDVTDLREMERRFKLMETLSLMGEMSVGLAHELKNALLPVRLLADLEEWDKEDVSLIKQAIGRVDRVVVNMLNFAKQDREAKSYFSLRELMEGLKNLFEHIVREKKINFVYDCEDLEVYMERGALELILVNLVKNAMDAVGVGGKVELRVEKNSGKLVFSVIDDGPGIPGDIREKIFEPFFTTKKGGTGLGLSIAMRYAYMLGGQISLKPSESNGTVMSLEVPFNAKGVSG
ncbi:MAG: ATP-binding protein [Aquificaceae bacterium]|nr:ATP-binding protein [Aquificaceae bacterium]MDW8433925.1 ATP-binding protein [Aquificaceae bacterium]